MSDAQRKEALALANEVRMAGSALKREVHALSSEDGAERVAAIMDAPEGHEGAVQVGPLLLKIRRIGAVRVRQFLMRAGVGDHNRRVSQLSERQRQVLARELRLWVSQRRDSQRKVAA